VALSSERLIPPEDTAMCDSDPPKPTLRWYQFTLRKLLVFVALLSVPLSWLGVKLRQAEKQRQAVVAIEKLGGKVLYEFDYPPPRGFDWQPPGPTWLEKLNVDFFSDVASVRWQRSDIGDDEIACLKDLPKLKEVGLMNTQVTDAGLEHLKGLPELQTLHLHNTQITVEGVKGLRRALPRCKLYYDVGPW